MILQCKTTLTAFKCKAVQIIPQKTVEVKHMINETIAFIVKPAIRQISLSPQHTTTATPSNATDRRAAPPEATAARIAATT